MNKKVLKASIYLLWIFLLSFTIVKLFLGDWFLDVVENEKILLIGSYIDSNKWVTFIVNTVVSCLSAQFYFCSCKQVWRLTIPQYAIVFLHVLAVNLCAMVNPLIHTVLDLTLMIALPLVFHCKLSQVLLMFGLNQLSQILTLVIRSESLYLASTNYATSFILFFDAQIWLVLYYLYSNLYKEETLWESLFLHSSVIKRLKNLRKKS